MDWNAPTLWWLATGALVAAELATGTFYLLMLAAGCAAAAVGAHLAFGATAQVVVAAVVGGGATVLWHLKRASSPRSAPSQSNRDVNLDIGQVVQVPEWGSDGTARISYRGASWSVRHAAQGAPAPGPHMIVAVEGSQLCVTPTTTH